MNKNNQLHDAHVKAYLQKQEIEFTPEQDDGAYQQTVEDLNKVQSDHVDVICNDINDALFHMDISSKALCDSIPSYIMRDIYKDLLARIGRDIVDNKYEY